MVLEVQGQGAISGEGLLTGPVLSGVGHPKARYGGLYVGHICVCAGLSPPSYKTPKI